MQAGALILYFIFIFLLSFHAHSLKPLKWCIVQHWCQLIFLTGTHSACVFSPYNQWFLFPSPRPQQEHALSCSSHHRLLALRDLLIRPSLFPSLDPLTKSCKTFLKSVCLSVSTTTNPITASFSWDLTRGFYIASLSPHLPNPSSTVSASQPGPPWRIQTASRLSSAHSLSRALFALTLRCCPFISDHTERDSRSNWKTVEVAILQIGRREMRSSIKQT